MHEFYEKPTRNPLVLLASSAHSWQVKRTVLTQEALRRMRNTSPLLDPAITNYHLSMFMVKLKDSGYSHKFRAEIIRSARNAYQIQLERHKNGTRPLYRDKQRIINTIIQFLNSRFESLDSDPVLAVGKIFDPRCWSESVENPAT